MICYMNGGHWLLRHGDLVALSLLSYEGQELGETMSLALPYQR